MFIKICLHENLDPELSFCRVSFKSEAITFWGVLVGLIKITGFFSEKMKMAEKWPKNTENGILNIHDENHQVFPGCQIEKLIE